LYWIRAYFSEDLLKNAIGYLIEIKMKPLEKGLIATFNYFFKSATAFS
jgi:hypothetical protein